MTLVSELCCGEHDDDSKIGTRGKSKHHDHCLKLLCGGVRGLHGRHKVSAIHITTSITVHTCSRARNSSTSEETFLTGSPHEGVLGIANRRGSNRIAVLHSGHGLRLEAVGGHSQSTGHTSQTPPKRYLQTRNDLGDPGGHRRGTMADVRRDDRHRVVCWGKGAPFRPV